MHWTPHHLCVDPPLPVQVGSTIAARVRRPPFGEWTWEVAVGEQTRKQSTFLGLPLRPEQLLARSPNARVALSPRGKARIFALSQFNGAQSNSEIAQRLSELHPTEFADFDAALRFVADLAAQNS